MGVNCVICGAEGIEGSDRCKEHLSTYLAAGPTIKRFHDCDKFVKGLMGPFGSSKSVACCFDLYYNAQMQRKQKDGIRRSRYGIARNTYKELWDTTIKTWVDWFDDYGEMNISTSTFVLK